MGEPLHYIEPFYGWLNLYSHETDPRSPYHGVEHNLFYFDRSMCDIPAHPLWDLIGSESLLIKILYADYITGFAIIELFGEWNDLRDNDFKLLMENCLNPLMENNIQKFIFICENVFHTYLESDDYYQAIAEELEEGWMCLIRPRQEMLEELEAYHINQYFYWNPVLDELEWRKLKPNQLYQLVESRMQKVLGA